MQVNDGAAPAGGRGLFRKRQAPSACRSGLGACEKRTARRRFQNGLSQHLGRGRVTLAQRVGKSLAEQKSRCVKADGAPSQAMMRITSTL